ncbi:thioesterase [Streptomyces actinomycinicus]|uniref:Thioesterase n=1 Tax=Streptomyces actinomycinicus TaxID=1695166 RepID=A0A937ENB5_9ACTN|nr:alpha/beta fold hydrolase [Streptomyces actinomycinicus]MBL1086493.1 thioesterase [Streptomyces actinomycinicus]
MPTLVRLAHRPKAAVRLYCLPPGGSGPEFYQRWADLLPATVEPYAFALPGRGNRRDEPSPTDPSALSAALASLTDDATDSRPFALFGHSFGALLAHETARRLRRTTRREPALVALSALPPPHQREFERLLATLVTSGLDAFTDLVGPLPAELLEDPVTVTRLCTPHLADLVLALHHRHHDEPPLQVSLALYGGETDPLVPPGCLEGWNDLFTTPTTPHLFAGRHTYPLHQAPALVRQLTKDLQRAIR